MTPLFIFVVAVWADAAPLPPRPDLEPAIDAFLAELYDKVHPEDIYERMQGDQPPDNNVNGDISKFFNVSAPANMSDYFKTSRDRQRDADTDDRARETWIQLLKENILRQIGRSNTTTPQNQEGLVNPMNISMAPEFLNSSAIGDEHITEKIRSYYPSCDTPTNMDQDTWKDDNVINLYFNNFAHNSDEKGLSIATATLRLYRIPSENSTKSATTKSPDCDSAATPEEDRLLRVSIYWYTRSVRKKKVKKHLADSKVIQENSRWVELSVKPATRAWSRGKNLGLMIMVEDQEGNILKADRFFKGALCTVGASTPKPIPTIIIDAARKSNELDQRIHSLLGRNSTASLSGDISMLPTIDICTLEFPENYSHSTSNIANLRINACNLKKTHDSAQLLAERDRFERLATLPEHMMSARHIRHQRQHLKSNDFDPRSKMINKRKLTNEELQALNLNITVNR